MSGLYLEEFLVGQKFEHQVTKTITQAENMSFCNMTLNNQPLHIDHNFAKKTEWKKPLVNSVLTLGLVIGISVGDTTLGTTIGNLEMSSSFPNPVFEGDTINVVTEVVSVRESKSKGDRGIVEFVHRGYNQNRKLVCECRRKAMMKKKEKKS